jgi:hypothetical protein
MACAQDNGAAGYQSSLQDAENCLWTAKTELKGLSGLFRNMHSCELSDEELAGIGLSLEQISKRIDDVLKGFHK